MTRYMSDAALIVVLVGIGASISGCGGGSNAPTTTTTTTRLHSDVMLSWPEGGGHGACETSLVAQGSNVITTNGNDITITTNNAPSGSCVFRNANPSVNIDEFPHLEVDLQTSGTKAAPPGMRGGMWFSFWMFPPQRAYKPGGNPESGEVDFIENINMVKTDFAGCNHGCQATDWDQSPVAVSGHITMQYDRSLEIINLYRCSHGSRTCGTNGIHSYIDLKQFPNFQKPYEYTFCADVWYAQPGFDFKFVVSNLRILRNASSKEITV